MDNLLSWLNIQVSVLSNSPTPPPPPTPPPHGALIGFGPRLNAIAASKSLLGPRPASGFQALDLCQILQLESPEFRTFAKYPTKKQARNSTNGHLQDLCQIQLESPEFHQ